MNKECPNSYSPAEFTYSIILRALNALAYCDNDTKDDLVFKLNGIADILAGTKFTVDKRTRPNPHKDYISRLGTAINVVVSVITKEQVDKSINEAAEPLAQWSTFWGCIDDMANVETKTKLRDKGLVKVVEDDNAFDRARQLCDSGKMNESVLSMLDAIEGWTVEGASIQQWRNLLACCEKNDFMAEWTRLGRYPVSVYFDHIITRISEQLELTLSNEQCSCNDCNICLLNILIDILDRIVDYENGKS